MRMESLPKRPHEYFVKLISIIDDLRRASFKSTPTTQQKKMLGLTFRQGSAIAQIKLLTMESPQGVALDSCRSPQNDGTCNLPSGGNDGEQRFLRA